MQALVQKLQLDKNDRAALEALGALFLDLKDHDGACDLFTRACEVGGSGARVWRACGSCHYQLWKENTVAKAHLLHAQYCYGKALKVSFAARPRSPPSL